MPYRNEGLTPEQASGVGVSVGVADIRNVVAFLFHPVGQRKLPEQELTRTLGKWCVKDLSVLAIGPIPTNPHPGPDVPAAFARVTVIVKGKELRPAIIGCPRGVTALKQKIAWAFIADDENHVALDAT